MNRRPRFAHRRTTTALAAVAASSLLLAACGSGNAGEEIVGLDRGPAQHDNAATDAPDTEADGDGNTDAPAEDDIDRPDIEVGDSLQLVFEEPDTGNPEHDAILTDSQWQIKSVFEVLTSHDLENSSVSFYTTGESYRQDMESLEYIVEKGGTSEGIMRFTGHRVLDVEGDVAFVEYCRDFSDVRDTRFDTGEVEFEPNPDALPSYQKARLQRNDLGVWQTTDTEIEQESTKC
ncbi:hypothetical protein [Streptomyces lonarensis]|uniref:Lipoprotein n=1 Tax=Streptomyces lonarensis TaxID=700599 RepID=A0A7X6CZE3_9ACTN|nr:hypothetical protein [Streptomyces lonarensis]NJQ05254.1 hypothetical protein [Streptomyces lonarensis]